jgi:hypothetical protein
MLLLCLLDLDNRPVGMALMRGDQPIQGHGRSDAEDGRITAPSGPEDMGGNDRQQLLRDNGRNAEK